MLDFGLSAHNDTAAARQHRLLDPLVTVDDTPCREVGTLDVLQQLLTRNLGIVHISATSVDHLAEIVRRHVGRHADGDTARTVDNQQRNFGRQHRRLGNRIVEVQRPIDSLLVDVSHHLIGDFLHAGLGVTHRRRRVAVHRAEVALPVDQRITHGPILRQTHHCVVNRRIAVRVELTEYVADDTGRLTGRFVGIKVELSAHIVKDTTMYGFQTVTHVGQGTRNDDRHRIVDVRRFHLFLDVDGNDAPHQTGIFFFFRQHFRTLGFLSV